MFEIIGGTRRGSGIHPLLRVPQNPGIRMGLGKIRRREPDLHIGIQAPEQHRADPVHRPAKFGAPQLPAADQIEGLEEG
jgi:hypothetical protein